MRYYCLVTFTIPGYQWFIEMAKYIHLNAHPNISDLILIEEIGSECSIKQILHVIESNEIRLMVIPRDCIYYVTSSDEASLRLIDEINELKEEGWILNDWRLKESE